MRVNKAGLGKCVLVFSLLFTLLPFGCKNPFAPPSQEQQFPPGHGSLSLRIADDFAKTILPGTTDAIKAYRLIFTDADQADITVYRLKDELPIPVYLEAGTYTLLVTGYTDTAYTYSVAEGSPHPNKVVIEEGGSTICNVILAAYGVVPGEKGSFAWNITLPNSFQGDLTDEAKMIITLLSDGTLVKDLDLLGADSPDSRIGSIEGLDSDYYQITFTLKKAGYEDITWYETLHVYQNMASRFNHAFVDEDFNSVKYTVTFNYNHTRATDPAKQTRIQGGVATELLSAPARKGYVIDGWYTDAACTVGNKWNFVSQIHSSQTLYARWIIDMVPVNTVNNATFTMGDSSGAYDDEKSTRTITLGKFNMGKYPVTQEQYEEIMGSNPSGFKAAVTGESDHLLPVESITWYDAVEFCNALSDAEGLTPVYTISGADVTLNWSANGYRLPTEAEWEYACRAGTTSDFNSGGTITDDTGWYKANSGGRTHEVGNKPANAWGLHDMHGNVWEWCWDRYGDYGIETNNPKGPDAGINRVSRGGGWLYKAEYLRSAYRGVSTPEDAHKVLGFRVARGN